MNPHSIVLAIDDEPSRYSRLLNDSFPYPIVISDDPTVVGQYMNAKAYRVVAVLLDFDMRRMNGLGFVENFMVGRAEDFPVIVVSQNDTGTRVLVSRLQELDFTVVACAADAPAFVPRFEATEAVFHLRT
jgi:DNA-binding NtrC family response regulator